MSMPIFLSDRHHHVIDQDRKFFRLAPKRLFRARPPAAGEFGGNPQVAFFASDETGESCETNVVIVKRIAGGRMRLPFAVSTPVPLHDDGQIVDFLRGRGIDPSTMRSIASSGSSF
jgi:hypothetical protein